MKIEEIQSATLCNSEVLAHVLELKHRNSNNRDFTSTRTIRRENGTSYQRLDGKLRDLSTVVSDVISHFSHPESTLVSEVNAYRPKSENEPSSEDAVGTNEDEAEQSKRSVTETSELLRRLKPYGLTKSELLMITNHRPRSDAVLEVLIEEMESRLSAEQQREVLDIVANVYGFPTGE